MAALACAGCATQSRTVTAKDGTQTVTSTKAFLQTIQGYSDAAVSPDGILYTTQIQNLTGDVQMVQAIDSLIQHVAQTAILASGNTNLLNNTNAIAGLLSPAPKFALRRSAH